MVASDVGLETSFVTSRTGADRLCVRIARSFLDADGRMALRLSDDLTEEFRSS